MTTPKTRFVTKVGVSLGIFLIVTLIVLRPHLSSLPAEKRTVPNDSLYPSQLSFYHPGGHVAATTRSYQAAWKDLDIRPGITLDIERAWSITTGSRRVVVALLDDGFFYQHEDLAANIWKNPGESGFDANGYPKETNGIDDDHNGYIDDVMGWDFVFNDPDPDPYIFDGTDRSRIQPYRHSVSAMGIIGAQGNNGIGVAGINWQVSMMLLKIGAQGVKMSEIDDQRIERAVRAIRYAADNGARVINWSGFVNDDRPDKLATLKDAIRYAASKNVLLVAGAGNDGRDIDRAENCLYPQCIESENIVNVAEVDFKGELYEYKFDGQTRGSNWGIRRVQIAAIGDNFTTSLKDNRSVYEVSGGTSSAAPVVSGVAGLVLSARPTLTAVQLREVLMKSVTPLDSLKGRITSGGVVNAYRAVNLAITQY
ncbi:MAG TPA: S8 family serine peptidase [Terriglobia bacterium]|nr:S8 family serine peptidase [Terriglobia bacterium]